MSLHEVLLVLELENDGEEDEKLVDYVHVNVLSELLDLLPVGDDGRGVVLVEVIEFRGELEREGKDNMESQGHGRG